MAEPFLAEIRVFSFKIVPQGWMPCDGQILPIQGYQALFSLLRTQYGGDGITNFALPNLKGRAAIHPDVNMIVGQMGGEETHNLHINELPAHSHLATGGSDASSPTATSPTGNAWGTSFINSYAAATDGTMKADALSETGNNESHENRQPFIVFQYCIAVTGIWPPRN
jgi:microcystin-dependent protein